MTTQWKVPPPEVPAGKASVPNEQLQFYPRLHGDHPKQWSFPTYLDNPRCEWLQAIKDLYAQPITFPASLSPEAGLFIHSMIRNFKPRTIVEIGSFLSVSTHWMASALKENGIPPGDGVIHCFDDFGPIHKGPWRDEEMLEGRLEWVQDRLTKAGLIDFVRFHPGDSSVEVSNIHDGFRNRGGIDFAFIDGDHTLEGAVQDFWAVEPVLNTGAFILVHDTFPDQCGGYEGPRHLCDHINEIGVGLYEKCELYLSPLNYGMALFRRIG